MRSNGSSHRRRQRDLAIITAAPARSVSAWWTQVFVAVLHVLLLSSMAAVAALALQQQQQQPRPSAAEVVALLSRRDYFRSSVATLAAAAVVGTATGVPRGNAAVGAATLPPPAAVSDRNQLLAAIARQASDEEIIGIIHHLVDPSNGRAALLPDRLDGAWELIWSYGAEGFSPLLKLPPPLRPQSYQYLGNAAANEVGPGRIAQGLTGGILFGDRQLWLSSGAAPYPDDPSVLEIQPPFRLQWGGRYGSGQDKITLVEAGSDADFRQLNARSVTAQQAGKNQYQQLYLEDDAGPGGALRVSTVIAGDPVLVGEIFVHRKL
jgi:hypothetical protein